VALIPVMGFTDITFMEYSLVADHYQHIALIGVVALVAAGWSTWRQRMRGQARWAADAAAAALSITLAILTWRQSSLYSDSITLYSASLQRNPGAWMVHNNLGAELFKAGRTAEAIAHDERALALKPDYPEAHNNLGNALSRSGRLPEAIAHYEEALRLRPTYSDAHNNLGSVLAYTGRFEEGIAHLRDALRLKPGNADARKNLEIALALQKKKSNAAEGTKDTQGE
jgi:tetratricopeptide (TPR) repeat protein